MRRMLFGLAVGLLTFASSAWADGPIVRWDQVVGVSGHESDSANLVVAGIYPTPRWVTIGGGRVVLNLDTGSISIDVDGWSRATHILGSDAVMGSTPTSFMKGALVCKASERYGTPTVIYTGEFAIDQGTARHNEVLGLTDDCRQYPEDLVFLLLLRLANGSYGPYQAFGADRHIQ